MDKNSEKGADQGGVSVAKKIRLGIHSLRVAFGETFGLGPGAALAAVVITVAVLMIAGF